MVVDNKTFEKVVFKNGFEIYKHHDAIPIEGVAEALGLNPKPNGSGGYRIHCPSPDHEDNNPSTDLQINGKYENTFKCWSCGEHGGPLELVIAVQGGIAPSKYWDIIRSHGEAPHTKKEFVQAMRARDEAARFIENIYPGAIKIEHIENGQKVEKEEKLERPELPSYIWRELKNWVNVDRSVGFQKFITINNEDTGKEERVNFGALDDYGYANLIYDKLYEVESCLKSYKRQILHDFPDLDAKAKMVIIKTIEERIDKIDIHIERYREYMLKVMERDYPAENPFDHILDDFDEPEEAKE